jgi:hypothetical protein
MSARMLLGAMLAITLLLGACANTPPTPNWQGSAFAALNSFSSAYLEGNSRVADFEFQRAQGEVARTGRPDLMARLALVRCAVQVASLVLDTCDAYNALAADALPTENNYAAVSEWSVGQGTTRIAARALPRLGQTGAHSRTPSPTRHGTQPGTRQHTGADQGATATLDCRRNTL